MSTYTDDHAAALLDVAEAGAPVTFSLVSPGTYDSSTDTYSTPATVSVPCSGIEVDGNPVLYKELGITLLNPATLFITPTTYGDRPALGMSCEWGGITRVVKSFKPLAPNGTAIGGWVAVST